MTGKIEMPLMQNNITRDDLDKVITFPKEMILYLLNPQMCLHLKKSGPYHFRSLKGL